MYCLDTNIIISIFRGDKGLSRKIDGIHTDEIFFTVITLCELLKGAYKSVQKEKSLGLVKEFVSNYGLLGLTANSCEIFGQDFNYLEKAGKQTEQFDLITASIAKEHGFVLATRNKKHFENIPKLKLEEW